MKRRQPRPTYSDTVVPLAMPKDESSARLLSAEDRAQASIIVPRSDFPHLNPRGALIAQWQTPVVPPALRSRAERSPALPREALGAAVPPSTKALPAAQAIVSSDNAGNKALDLSAVTSLESLRAVMAAFNGCDLKKLAKNLVFADGNPNARVMLIGEAPGAEEDARGVPFVGASGQLLDKMLAAIGFDRQQVYISNIIPWRPPANRPPSTQEIALCLPFIRKHIELVAPSYVVCLGGTATKALLGRSEGLARLRGTWHPLSLSPVQTVQVLVTFHPAYLLRSPGQKREAWRDLQTLQRALAGERP